MKIYIDIGHGGSDPGAVSGKFIEHNMAVITAKALSERLKFHGAQTKLEEGNLTISASAAAANAYGADLLLSQHYNAGGGNRGEAIYSIRAGSGRLADAVLEGLRAAGQTTVRKYSKLNSAGNADYYGILRSSKMPAVIIEPCFIDNAEDVKLADTAEKQEYLGICIADSIAREYGFYKEDKKMTIPSNWASEAAQWALNSGIIKGDETGDCRWQDNMTREELAVVLYRFKEIIK